MPTKWPCDNAIACPCDENPLFNISSENPDPFTFFARRFFPNVPYINDPPGVFVAPSCGQSCTSAISQEDADACALREAVLCVQPPPPPDVGDPMLFGNRAISCSAECPEGPPFVLNIAAGTYIARTQEMADLIAQSFCNSDVIRLRQCDMPGPPPDPTPGTQCPVITGSSPASPVNLQAGDDVTLIFTYTYNSPSMLMFVWYLNGVPTYATMSAQLSLMDVTDMNEGQYILGIFASGCFPVFSNPIQVNVAGCPAEIGDPAPDTLDIEHPVDWEVATLSSTAQLVDIVSVNPFCNPTFECQFTPSNGLDHPPGAFGLKYVSGYLDGGGSGGCPMFTTRFEVSVFRLTDEDFNFDEPIACNGQGLANVWRTMPGDPPPTGSFGGGLNDCYLDGATAQAAFTAYFADKRFVQEPYPPDNVAFNFFHTNTSGSFSIGFLTDVASFPAILSPLSYQIIQITGNIPQPRKLQINDFFTIAAQFSNPALAANWSGDFNTRDAYTSTDLRWEAGAIGAFGGAKVSYITNHPTSTNGKGWKIEIYGAGPALVWQGLKAIDATSEGRYYRDNSATPTGPDCLSCIDASDTQWFPDP